MSYVVTPTFTGTKVAAATVTNIVPMPGATPLSYIHRTGSTFMTNGVVPGDGAVIAGSGAGNNGTYRIVSIPNQSVLIVRATLTAEAGVATVAVANGAHVLTITDEATTSWNAINTAVGESAYVIKRDARQRATVSPSSSDYVVYEHCFERINIAHTGATLTTWTSLEEIVFSRQSTVTATAWSIQQLAADPGTVVFNLGSLGSAHRRSYRNGSVWVGCNFNIGGTKGTLNLYGSLLVPGELQVDLLNGGRCWGSIVNGSFVVSSASQTGAGVDLQDFLMYQKSPTASAPVVVDKIAKADNWIIGDAGTQGVAAFGTTALLESIAISDLLPVPFFGVIFQAAEFRDPQEDYDITVLASTITGNAAEIITKTYTYNPKVIQHRLLMPVQGATVSIFEINNATPLTGHIEIPGSPFTTDANGRINAGAGVVLEVQRRSGAPPGAVINKSHRIVIEAFGFELRDDVTQLSSKFVSPAPLRFYEAPLEGEEPTMT